MYFPLVNLSSGSFACLVHYRCICHYLHLISAADATRQLLFNMKNRKSHGAWKQKTLCLFSDARRDSCFAVTMGIFHRAGDSFCQLA